MAWEKTDTNASCIIGRIAVHIHIILLFSDKITALSSKDCSYTTDLHTIFCQLYCVLLAVTIKSILIMLKQIRLYIMKQIELYDEKTKFMLIKNNIIKTLFK